MYTSGAGIPKSGLRNALKDARIIAIDSERELTLAWFGGHGIHAYDDNGTEIHFWNTGQGDQNDATEAEIRDSMERHINGTTEYA